MLRAISATVFLVISFAFLTLASDFLSPESQVVIALIAFAGVAWAFVPRPKRDC